MEQLLKNIEKILHNKSFESVDTFIDHLIKLNIPKENIKTYTINKSTEVSIVLPDSLKTIDISINIK